METLPRATYSLLKGVFKRYWVRTLVLGGVFSCVTFSLMGLTCLFTYMRVSHDYKVEMEQLGTRLLMDVCDYSAKVGQLEGEIFGYQKVIGAFSRKGRRKSLGTFTVTAYDPDESCIPYNDGYTSIGLPVGDGIFAVDPKKIAYGSFLHIPAINKYGIAGDTGAAMRRSSNAIDVFIPMRKDAIGFGRQELEVELIEFD